MIEDLGTKTNIGPIISNNAGQDERIFSGGGDVPPIVYYAGGTNVGDYIGAIISGAAQLGAAGINAASQASTNETNKKMAEEANELQKQMYDTSMKFEERKFAEQQYENVIGRIREDNAIQRRAADLAAAGINPMLAGLSGAESNFGGVAGNAIHGFTPIVPTITAPQIDAQALATIGEQINQSRKLQEENRHNKKLEKQAETNANNTINMFNDELKSRNLNAEEERKAQKGINLLHDITSYVTAERHNKSQEEIAKQERELKWKIEKHEAIKELIGATGIPSLDAILKDFVDAFTDKETFDLLKNNDFAGTLKAWWSDLFTNNTQILNENEINGTDKTPTLWRRDEDGREYILKGGAKVYKK